MNNLVRIVSHLLDAERIGEGTGITAITRYITWLVSRLDKLGSI